MNIERNNIWKNVGVQTFEERRPARDFVSERRINPETAPEFILGLIWTESDCEYLSIRATYRHASASKSARDEDFSSDRNFARSIFPDWDVNRDPCLFALVRHDTQITLEFTIDTDHCSFLRQNQQGRPTGIAKALYAFAYGLPAEDGPSDQQDVFLRLRPVQPMDEFSGLVALDLGNTSSTLVLTSSELEQPPDRDPFGSDVMDPPMHVVDVEGRLGSRPGPVRSALRIDSRLPDHCVCGVDGDGEACVADADESEIFEADIDDEDESEIFVADIDGEDVIEADLDDGGFDEVDFDEATLHRSAEPLEDPPPDGVAVTEEPAASPTLRGEPFARYECVIGKKAVDESRNGWLLLGAKRILSDVSDPEESDDGDVSIYLDGESYPIPRREPAEVFVGEMLRKFNQQQLSFPDPIGITHPTTFSSSEINRLREAVYQAWRRSRNELNTPYSAEEVHDFVKLVIDEASAAGFYFLYRDFINGPGRLAGFRYLYPNGMHLLIYDCGGGTTDISLIYAVARDDTHLKIEVKGRTGHRGFGGDEITCAVFRLLKAHVAAAMGGPKIPDAPVKWTNFLNENDETFDRLVPTRFYDAARRSSLTDDRIRQASETALLVWKWAENVKHELSSTNKSSLEKFPTLTSGEHARLGELLGVQGDKEETWNSIGSGAGFRFGLQDVNQLVDKRILESIQYANHLIAARLPEDAEIEALYVVGNASQYPRIHELLADPEQGIGVRFLKERLAAVELQDLKTSVAKGALRALQLDLGMLGVKVEFDKKLSERLPYDVSYRDLSKTEDPVLFKEHQAYEQLGVGEIEIPEDHAAQLICLDRTWPGDSRPSPFLEFRFPTPVRGRLLVAFDKHLRRFTMRPEQDHDAFVVGRPPVGSVARTAPVQGGRL